MSFTWSDYRPRRKALLIQLERLERENARLIEENKSLIFDIQFQVLILQDCLEEES